MKLSTRARYGLRICFLMGLKGELISLSALSSQSNLSEKYLEQILAMLKKAGIVASQRGQNGGYVFTRPPCDITINQILTALDDNFEITFCVKGECEDEYCPNRKFFSSIFRSITSILDNTSLQDMIDDTYCEKRSEYEKNLS
jgi:Rrf2 family protein